MDKILINLYVPVIGETYDICVPDFLEIRQVIRLFARALAEQTPQYVSSGQELLCLVDENAILREEYSFRDYNIQNGAHLLLC